MSVATASSMTPASRGSQRSPRPYGRCKGGLYLVALALAVMGVATTSYANTTMQLVVATGADRALRFARQSRPSLAARAARVARDSGGAGAGQRRDLMWDLSCLSRPSGPAEALLLSQGWSLTLVVILALALLLSVVASPFVQRAYRRRIVRLMGFNQIAPRPSPWWSAQALPPNHRPVRGGSVPIRQATRAA